MHLVVFLILGHQCMVIKHLEFFQIEEVAGYL
jgi:hypothetical protein